MLPGDAWLQTNIALFSSNVLAGLQLASIDSQPRIKPRMTGTSKSTLSTRTYVVCLTTFAEVTQGSTRRLMRSDFLTTFAAS